MSQNTSHAVMAQRAEPNDSLDFFPTPLWATRALFQHVIGPDCWKSHIGWDPACGDGAMYRAMREYFQSCVGTDVHDYGCGFTVHDFLQPYIPDEVIRADWLLFNPPFRLAEQFIHRALSIAKTGVAVLVRSVFIESAGRYDGLFRDRQPSVMAQFVERVPMVKGRLDKNASTATSYCWLVWNFARTRETRLVWIPPCRSKLERASDWPST